MNWHILTGEYPPQPGGVSDYTRLVAQGLAGAGDKVHVWSTPCAELTPSDEGVEVHRLPDHFGPRSLSLLNGALRPYPESSRILVQYVPQAFGWKGLNLPFCLWLSMKRRQNVWVMFHEVYYPLRRRQPLSHNVLGVGTRLMAALVVRAAQRVFVSTPGWNSLLKPLASKDQVMTWLPVPSCVPVQAKDESGAVVRGKYAPVGGGRIIGHFGSFGRNIAELLLALLPPLLSGREDRALLLLGHGGKTVRDEFIQRHPELSGKVHATGALPGADISRHLSACDIMVQPFVDGVSGRRTSVMAGMAHGLPVVTTIGPATEPVWQESGAVALTPVGDMDAMAQVAERLLVDDLAREVLGQSAIALYQARFDIRHTISTLRV